MTMVLTVLIGSLASFALSRTRLSNGWLLVNAPLLTYAVPASSWSSRSLGSWQVTGSRIPVGDHCGKRDVRHPVCHLDPAAVRQVIPIELDEAARMDGASPVRVYLRIYLPLMAPALAAVGTYRAVARLERVPLPVRAALLDPQHDGGRRDRPVLQQRRGTWNYMMATASSIRLPPIVIFYALRRFMARA
jgi:multiple sugar transport system permease protein